MVLDSAFGTRRRQKERKRKKKETKIGEEKTDARTWALAGFVARCLKGCGLLWNFGETHSLPSSIPLSLFSLGFRDIGPHFPLSLPYSLLSFRPRETTTIEKDGNGRRRLEEEEELIRHDH